jgi:hypothetical protein
VAPEIKTKMTMREFYLACEYWFKRKDQNGDTWLNDYEFKNLYIVVMPKTKFRYETDEKWKSLWKVYDINGDNKVYWSEFWLIAKLRENYDYNKPEPPKKK